MVQKDFKFYLILSCWVLNKICKVFLTVSVFVASLISLHNNTQGQSVPKMFAQVLKFLSIFNIDISNRARWVATPSRNYRNYRTNKEILATVNVRTIHTM